MEFHILLLTLKTTTMKKLFILLATIVATVISIDAYAQQTTVTVTGRIVYRTLDNEEGPVIGANVVVKDRPSIGCTTDIDGIFSFTIPNFLPGTQLQISFIGFAMKTVAISKRPNIDGEIYLGKIVIHEEFEIITDNIVYSEPTVNLAISNKP